MNLVLALLDAGWDLNGGNCQFTPVLDAIYNNHEHIARFLIGKESRIDQDLLKPAADHGLTSIVRILLSKGVDVNAPSYGQTALEAAATTTHNPEGRLELVKLLLENGADVRIGQGEPLVLRATVQGFEDITKLLIETGAPLDGKRSDGATIVHYAAEFGYLDVIRALIAKRARFDVQDNYGGIPLHLAARKGDTQLMKTLLEATPGEVVDIKNNRKCTTLHEAVTANNIEAARVIPRLYKLLASGTSCSGTPCRDCSAFH
jgi:ankyrin repeat protein